MLNQHDGHALGIHAGDGLDLPRGFGLVEPGERLVEQDDLRIDGECPRHFEPLHLTERQRAGKLAFRAGQADANENLGRAFALGVCGRH